MYQLNLPQYDIRLGGTKEKPTIFDVLRRKHVALTPEEWVRQHFIHYLIEHKGYPQAWLANEVELKLNDKRMRCDSVLYNNVLQPRMIIEYKAPNVALQQKVFDQIAAYNLLLHVDYLIMSNGIQHICCRMDYENKRYIFLEDIPDFSEITQE